MARECDGKATNRFSSSHLGIFLRLRSRYPALLMSAMTKAKFNPRRKVIQFRSRFRPGPSSPRGLDDGVGKGLRRLLRQVVSDATSDQAMDVFSGKLPRVSFGVRMRGAVGVAFQGDRRHGDGRQFGQPL